MAQVELGQKYRDTISGFEGVATARYEFLYGCVRYLLEGEIKDGKEVTLVVDEQRLVDRDAFVPDPTATTGGVYPNPPSRDPR